MQNLTFGGWRILSINFWWLALAPESSMGGSMLREVLLLTPCVHFSWPEPGHSVALLPQWIH